MNLLSLFKNKQSALLFVTLLAVAIFGFVSVNYILSIAVLTVLIISLFIPSDSADSTKELTDAMYKVLKNAAAGNLEGRITHIPNDNSSV